MGYVNYYNFNSEYNNESGLNHIDDDQEQLIKQYYGISFKVEIEFPEPGLVKYVAYPSVDTYDPGMRLVLEVEYIDKPAEDDVDDETLEYFHQLILNKLFEMADSVRQQKIQDWVGLDNPNSSN